MRIKKRAKTSRYRGTHTHGRGFKKKARGSGHQGGKGMAGTGKRGDAKKSLIINLYGNDYFGKDKTLRAGNKPVKPEVINLGQIATNVSRYEKAGKLDLSGYKILGEGEPTGKWMITAHSASQSAMEKVKKAGGSITTKFAQADMKAEAKPAEKKEAPKKAAK